MLPLHIKEFLSECNLEILQYRPNVVRARANSSVSGRLPPLSQTTRRPAAAVLEVQAERASAPRPKAPWPLVAVLRRAAFAALLIAAHSRAAAMPSEAGEPAFSVHARCGAARTGTLRGGLETPAVLLYTRRGFPAPLTLRELRSLSGSVPNSGPEPAALGVQVSAAELIDEPGAAVLRKVPGGLKEFCGLHGRNDLVLLSARDSLTIQAGMPASDGWATLQTPAGQKKVTAAEYGELVGAVQPDVVVCLADEVFADSNDKKMKKSVDRTALWMDECIKARADARIPAKTLIFGPIVGGLSERERAASAQEAAKREELDGYALLGFGSGESSEARLSLMKSSLEPLNAAKPRFITGLGAPNEILWCAAHGFDLIESAYAYLAAAQGIALTFNTDYDDLIAFRPGQSGIFTPGAGGKLNLWDTSLSRDTRPIVEGCKCFACGNYTRAYVHHLLNTHEMLAEVFLTCHNQHVMLTFMRSIRQAIARDSLPQFADAFCAVRAAGR